MECNGIECNKYWKQLSECLSYEAVVFTLYCVRAEGIISLVLIGLQSGDILLGYTFQDHYSGRHKFRHPC